MLVLGWRFVDRHLRCHFFSQLRNLAEALAAHVHLTIQQFVEPVLQFWYLIKIGGVFLMIDDDIGEREVHSILGYFFVDLIVELVCWSVVRNVIKHSSLLIEKILDRFRFSRKSQA